MDKVNNRSVEITAPLTAPDERDLKDWATYISTLLNDNELDQFALQLDGDANDRFIGYLNEINQVRNPSSY